MCAFRGFVRSLFPPGPLVEVVDGATAGTDGANSHGWTDHERCDAGPPLPGTAPDERRTFP
jgi:hypothetical protein